MKIQVYIILVLCLSISSCKRKRNINVEGIVIDVHTGVPAADVDVYLYSQISNSQGGGELKSYQQSTDENGYFSFKNAVFSNPGNEGWLYVKDEIYRDIDGSSGPHGIKKNDIKFIGKTNLTRNIEVVCMSNLNLNLNFSSSLNVTHATFYRKFISNNSSLPGFYTEFYSYGQWPATQSSGIPDKLIGYSDGKNIFRTEYFDYNTQTTKIRFDTIISQGCGSVNSYTINLN